MKEQEQAETSASAAAPAKKNKKPPRPLVRLALLLMAHRVLVSFLCCIGGVIALLALPILAKNTYISENALMPGSANPMLSTKDVSDGGTLVSDILNFDSEAEEDTAGMRIPRVIAKHIADLGAEASLFEFNAQPNKFHPLHFFSDLGRDMKQENKSYFVPAVSTVGIIRASRGDGKEALVLVTPYNALKPDAGEVLSLGVAYSVFSLLSRVTWLAKDIIWLAADSRFGEYESVAAWLREYYAPKFGSAAELHAYSTNYHHEWKDNQASAAETLEAFRRAGTMAAALVIKVQNEIYEDQDSLSIYAEASNGQMPNLDLINVVNYLAVHRQGLHVNVEKVSSLLDSKYLNIVGQLVNNLGKLAGSLNPQWGFGMPVEAYVDGAATLASSLFAQAMGIPTGPHGAFRDYQIDAVTLTISTRASPYNRIKRNDFLKRSGQLVEGLIRTVNNLLEKFHQSFFLYLLTAPSKFISVGVYMIAFALLIAPLPIVSASLYSEAIQCDAISDTSMSSSIPVVEPIISNSSWRWLHAAKTVFVIHIWAVVVALLPCVICQMPNQTPAVSILSWLLLSVLSLHLCYKVLGSPYSHCGVAQQDKLEWAMLKSVMVAATFIGLSLMSVVNFATAEIGALLLVPLVLMAHPVKLDIRARSVKTLGRIMCNVVIGLLGFPPLALFVVKGMFVGFHVVHVHEFWSWVESLWQWSSATYLYVVLVHLPSWVLCIHILLHPC